MLQNQASGEASAAHFGRARDRGDGSMRPHYSGRAGGAAVKEIETGPKFKSVRRVLRIVDLVSRRGENLTAKQLAREVETSLSNCYYLIHILVEEGYIERVPRNGGYRLGPAVAALKHNARTSFDATIEPVVAELARRSQRNVYTAVLSDGEVAVTQVKAPPDGPPIGVVPGFQGATHALALGKVLLAGQGSGYVDDYVDDHGLEAFTPRTITQPALLHAQLNKARMVGLATDFEEFALNLCCVAAPIQDERGKVQGAIGLSTTPRRIREEGQKHLIELVQWAGREASAMVQAGR